jgi:hypothetical protein
MEVLALRHQLNVLRRSVKRPKLTAADRFLWSRLSRFWTGWGSALVIVKPETVIDWHRKGFRLMADHGPRFLVQAGPPADHHRPDRKRCAPRRSAHTLSA